MREMYHINTQKACAWSGTAAVLLLFIAFFAGCMLPPPSPALSPGAVAAFYQQNASCILVGNVMVLFCSLLTTPTAALLAVHMMRREGQMPVMAYTQLGAGAVSMVAFFIPGTMFLVAAFRPDRPVEITYLMNDIAWMTTVLFWQPFALQFIAVAIFIFNERVAAPLFPPWFAYLSLGSGAMLSLGSFTAFVKSGLFEWNGLLVFWLPGALFSAWYVIVLVFLLKAIGRQAGEAAA